MILVSERKSFWETVTNEKSCFGRVSVRKAWYFSFGLQDLVFTVN
jgi:hypothetical protein